MAALKVETSNVEAITVAKTMAIAQETGLFGKRKESSHYAKKILEEYPQFTGSYFGYEPNADQDDKEYLHQVGTDHGGLDANGRFLPYWFSPGLQAKPLNETPYKDILNSFYQNTTGRPNLALLTDPVDGQKYFYGGVPITTGDWTLVMRVSEEEILSTQK